MSENFFKEVELITCSTCGGYGRVECCGGHMCPGDKDCYDCGGRGMRLSEEDRARREVIKKLMEYR